MAGLGQSNGGVGALGIRGLGEDGIVASIAGTRQTSRLPGPPKTPLRPKKRSRNGSAPRAGRGDARSRATLTLLGQSKVSVSCVPQAKNSPNVHRRGMYVVLRSPSSDLKTLSAGRGKMDINTAGFKDGDACSDDGRHPYVTVAGWGKYGKGIWITRCVIPVGVFLFHLIFISLFF